MNTYKLSNIPLRKFRAFLFEVGCNRTDTNGGHEKWEKAGLARPIILQTHIDPIPEHIVKATLFDLCISRKEFFEIYYKL